MITAMTILWAILGAIAILFSLFGVRIMQVANNGKLPTDTGAAIFGMLAAFVGFICAVALVIFAVIWTSGALPIVIAGSCIPLFLIWGVYGLATGRDTLSIANLYLSVLATIALYVFGFIF
jgi:hypothetical protein